jgi:hypothetical protein
MNMEIDFPQLMSQKSDEGLQKYLDDRAKYVPEAVEAAIAEMQKRGGVFPDDELATPRQDLQQLQEKREAIEKSQDEYFGKTDWKKNVVSDANASVYYSERAINGFSIGLGVLFGAVLLAINFRKTECKKGVVEVIAFGVVYTILQIWLLSVLLPNRNTAVTYMCSAFGALILNKFFWKKYIGKDVKYRARSIRNPLIVGGVILVLFVVAIAFGS